ncbi:MAG: aminodeoxychorismate synthase component I [Armatimonadota bacterium]|nr:aminodeoxychorismate synthase component I [Armatimonadota bacterium]
MEAPFLQFDFASDGRQANTLTFAEPLQVITAHTEDEVRPALRAVQQAAASGLYAAGYIAYEAAPAFDPAFGVCPQPTALPLLWFGIFSAPVTHIVQPETSGFAVSDWQPDVSRAEYSSNVAAVREALGRGDSYQVNYTVRMRAGFTGDDYAWYQRLRAAQDSGYAAYLNLGRYKILSVSPELFFQWDGATIETRPMKGTMPRGRWPEEDEHHAAWLASSPKNQAENVMIVDLLRNDLSRISQPGTVCVSKLFQVERYPTVLQMTSTVIAETNPAITLEDIFEALFPCGSVTGAPKISTMRLIAALEKTPRQVYCGAIGFVTPGGCATFNVAIRTVVVDSERGQAEYGVGGGITWDSNPEDEYAEIWAKTAVLTEGWPEFDLLESIRLEDGSYTLLQRHLDRLESSARYFDISISMDKVRAALIAHAQAHALGSHKVRLLLSKKGGVRVESGPLAPLGKEPLRVALAKQPVSSHDRFLFHKTTNRRVYEAARMERPDVFDVLLSNEKGELTEFTTGNLVIELDGQLWTPPRECGLLAGTFRDELLACGVIHERVLAVSELHAASKLWLVNSVRGWVRVELVP